MNAYTARLREGVPGMDGLRPLERRQVDDVTTVYLDNYRQLVRIAALMLAEPAAAEDVVQDAYLKVTAKVHRIQDSAKLLAYLRQTVVNGARSHTRRRLVALRHAPLPEPDAPGADEDAYAALRQHAVAKALRTLSRRQREVLVLRYYADLTEEQTAYTLGISVGSVKAYASRGIDALGDRLEDLR
jgi:RNA polymerase sigma-70 factor (sigma-E family)